MNTAQLEAMETAAGTAGDLMQAAICQLAMYGSVNKGTWAALSPTELDRVLTFNQTSALAECERVSSGELDK